MSWTFTRMINYNLNNVIVAFLSNKIQCKKASWSRFKVKLKTFIYWCEFFSMFFALLISCVVDTYVRIFKNIAFIALESKVKPVKNLVLLEIEWCSNMNQITWKKMCGWKAEIKRTQSIRSMRDKLEHHKRLTMDNSSFTTSTWGASRRNQHIVEISELLTSSPFS